MPTKPTLFNATPGTIIDAPNLDSLARNIPLALSSSPSLHFIVAATQPPLHFYLMAFATWRTLPPPHPASGIQPLFSGTLLQLRTLAAALPLELPLDDIHAPDA